MVAKRGYRHHDQQLSFFVLMQKNLTLIERSYGLYWISVLRETLRKAKEV